MAIVTRASGTFIPGSLSTQLTMVLPDRFRLVLKRGRLGAAVRRKLDALGEEIEFDVHGLLTLAPLRHGGAPYSDGAAVAKETMSWHGWLDAHLAGPLHGRLVVNAASNSGRQSEFSAGLAECIAVAVLTDLLSIPLATIMRIPETGNEGMDFRTSGPDATAIESKAGHGSCVSVKKREIAEQMKRQTAARNKYGAILCYEKKGHVPLKRKGSYLYLYDPSDPPRPAEPVQAILHHYLRIANAIGFWLLVDGLRRLLGLPEREHATHPTDLDRRLGALATFRVVGQPGSQERRSSLVALSRSGPGICFDVSGRPYLARAFLYESLLGLTGVVDPYPRPVTVIGLSFDVARELAEAVLMPESTDLCRVFLGDKFRQANRFQRVIADDMSPRYYTGLEDGVVRVDLVSIRALRDEPLDI